MNYYETLVIIHPALESGRLKDIILGIEKNLKKETASILSIDLWGKKRLAYLIEKQKYGTYVKLQFSGPGSCINKLEVELQHNANILSYLTTIISQSDISKETTDLETQIAGQSRESQTIIGENKVANNQAKEDNNKAEEIEDKTEKDNNKAEEIEDKTEKDNNKAEESVEE